MHLADYIYTTLLNSHRGEKIKYGPFKWLKKLWTGNTARDTTGNTEILFKIYFALQSAWYSSRQSNSPLCSVLSQTFISTETQIYSDPLRHPTNRSTIAPMRHPRCDFGVRGWRNKARLEEKVTLPKIDGIRCLHQDVPHAKWRSENCWTHQDRN